MASLEYWRPLGDAAAFKSTLYLLTYLLTYQDLVCSALDSSR